jgi:NADPH-dependent F420 reductase
MKIGLVGGTGKEGTGLSVRWAQAGHSVAIGSRDAARAVEKAAELSASQGVTIRGAGNAEICADADVIVLCVPYAAHKSTLEGLKDALSGKVVVDITVPLKPPAVRDVHLPEGQSAALEAQAILGDSVRLVAALHHVSSVHLQDHGHAIACDVLVCSNDADAKETVIALIQDLGMRGLDAGSLKNAVALESLTPVLLYMNKRYKSEGTGLHITGIPG